MEYKNIIDMHTHTDNSFDGNHSTMYLCESAYKKGIRAIAFTDHCEVDAFYQSNGERTVLQSYFSIAKARSAFRGRLLVLAGIELGQPSYDPETAEHIMSSQKYDFVIGSLHNLRQRQDFYFMDFTNTSVKEAEKLLDEYFDELYGLVEWGKFDTLAHITYPFRYINGDYKVGVDVHKYDEKIAKVLKLLAEKDLALEINTSGLRQNLKSTLPEPYMVKMFKDFGGKHITIGSDAHAAKDLGFGIDVGMKIADECGFENITIFQNREAIEIPIGQVDIEE